MKGNSSSKLLRKAQGRAVALLLTWRLRAQDVGERDVLEPVRFSDLIVILGGAPFRHARNTEAKYSQESGGILSVMN
jgi:hypothetical protein